LTFKIAASDSCEFCKTTNSWYPQATQTTKFFIIVPICFNRGNNAFVWFVLSDTPIMTVRIISKSCFSATYMG
jgi:hypothetical protein